MQELKEGMYIYISSTEFDKIISVKGKVATTESGRKFWTEFKTVLGTTFTRFGGRNKKTGYFEVGKSGYKYTAYNGISQQDVDRYQLSNLTSNVSNALRTNKLTLDQLTRIISIINETP